MGVPKLDDRMSVDRIYPYGEYRKLQDKYGRRRAPRGAMRPLVNFPRVRRQGANRIRLLPFKLITSVALTLMVAGIIALSFFRADMVRLAYAEQDLGAARVDQSIYEAQGNVAAAETKIVSGGSAAASAVVYPNRVKCIVRTNIPDVDGKTLVEQLYPLSSEIIKIEP